MQDYHPKQSMCIEISLQWFCSVSEPLLGSSGNLGGNNQTHGIVVVEVVAMLTEVRVVSLQQCLQQ